MQIHQMSVDFPKPKTAMEFERAWRALKDDNSKFSDYVRSLEPQGLPALFKESLTSQMLVSILHTLDTMASEDTVYVRQFLWHLTLVPRFSMLIMFLTSSERHVVAELLNRLSDDDKTKPLDVLKQKYRTV